MSIEGDEAARVKIVHNERTKLAATCMNGSAIATIAVGGLAPLAQTYFETMGSAQIAIVFLVGALLAGSGAYWFARRFVWE